MNEYSIPKPQLPAAAWALAGLLAFGLIGLGTAAYNAFLLIGHWWQALAFALVIEAGAIVEALALVRGNKYAIPALAIGLPVSISYNWTQAEQAAAVLAVPLPAWQVAALAIGPLSAVFFIALALGRELQNLDKARAQWAADRQKWQDDRETKENRRLERKEARLERQERARERQELAAVIPGTFQGTGANVPANVPPVKGTYPEYKAFMQANGANHSRAELAEKFNVTERAITKWAAKYREESPTPALQEQLN